MATLLDPAVEKSTYIVAVSFKDEDGETMVPLTANWSLRDTMGAIVNSRDTVSITPATTVNIVLSGNDLSYEENSSHSRTLTVTGTYNSRFGAGLPFADEYTFEITSLVGVS